MDHVKKFLCALLLTASVANAQLYPKSPIPPTIPAHTVIGNSTGATAHPGALTSIPASLVPVYSGDCGNSIASSVLVCTQAAGNYNVVGTLSEGVLNPPTTIFAPQEIDFTGTGTSTLAPNVTWNNTTGGTNYKAWNCNATAAASAGNFICGTQTVNAAGQHNWINVTRGGTNPYDISDISFGSAGTSNNTTHFLGTGLITLGSAPLTTASTISSTLATGTAPFTVASTTNVSNLNASLLGGATFAAPGPIGSGTPSAGAFTTVSATSTVTPGTVYVHGVTVICTAAGTNASGTPLFTHTGDSNEFNLLNCTIPAGSWTVGASLRITALWYRSATTTNTVAYTIRVTTQAAISGGDVPLTTTNASSGVVWTQTESILFSVDSTHQLVSTFGTLLTGTNTAAPSVGTLNTANVQYVNFNCKDTTSTSDTCGIYAYLVELVTP